MELKQATEYEHMMYIERRQRSVGTHTSRKVGGRGNYTIETPLIIKGRHTSQRYLIDKYEESHFEERAKILAKLDTLDFLLGKSNEK